MNCSVGKFKVGQAVLRGHRCRHYHLFQTKKDLKFRINRILCLIIIIHTLIVELVGANHILYMQNEHRVAVDQRSIRHNRISSECDRKNFKILHPSPNLIRIFYFLLTLSPISLLLRATHHRCHIIW